MIELALGWPSLPKLPEWAKKLIADIEKLDINYQPFLQFMSGFADGFFTEMDLEEFDTCYTGGAAAIPYLKKAIKLFKAGHKARAITQLTLMAAALPGEIKNCKSMQDDIADIEQWGKDLDAKGLKYMAQEFTKHLVLHPSQTSTDIQ